jgi:F420-dependent methylenetetrahydromethanopterin dehydrogenase
MRDAVIETTTVRARLRESEHDARRLIARAAHIEKRAQRACADSHEYVSLSAIARELRAAAAQLLAEASELSRRVKTEPAIVPATRP